MRWAPPRASSNARGRRRTFRPAGTRRTPRTCSLCEAASQAPSPGVRRQRSAVRATANAGGTAPGTPSRYPPRVPERIPPTLAETGLPTGTDAFDEYSRRTPRSSGLTELPERLHYPRVMVLHDRSVAGEATQLPLAIGDRIVAGRAGDDLRPALGALVLDAVVVGADDPVAVDGTHVTATETEKRRLPGWRTRGGGLSGDISDLRSRGE